MGQQRQHTLDVVRGIAILLVLVFHLRFVTGYAALDTALAPLIDLGWVGVDLFFVLSGMLVGRMILAEIATSAGFDRRRFFVRRILRLWPVLYLYLAMLLAVSDGDAFRRVWPVIIHVQNYTTDIPSHLWSLAVEEHFYLIAAFALPPLLLRRGVRGVVGVLIAILVACLALRLIVLWHGGSTQALQWQTQYRVDAIAAGVLIACADLFRPALMVRLARYRLICLVIALSGFTLLAIATDERFRYSVGVTIAYVASASLILAVYRTQVPAVLAGPARLLAWFGGIAYSLYVFHVSLGRVGDVLASSFGTEAALLQLAGRYGTAIAGAAIIARFVERPFMRLRDRKPEPEQSRAAGRPLIDSANVSQ